MSIPAIHISNLTVKKIISKSIARLSYYFQKILRINWPQTMQSDIDNYAIVIVNSNTKEMLCYLLFSIFNNLGIDKISKIVVVDNASTDGSVQLLKLLEKNKLITLLTNKKQRYHGPGLTQGINYLSKLVRIGKINKPFKYIWILDSDVMILKNSVLNDVTEFIKENNAAVIGQFQFDHSKSGDPHISSLVIDPAKTWNRKFYPFINDGMPSILFYHSIKKSGLIMVDFPFRSQNYLLHIGSGTLKQINKSKDSRNQYYKWATNHFEHHYHGNINGKIIHKGISDLFLLKVGETNDEKICDLFKSQQIFAEEFSSMLKSY